MPDRTKPTSDDDPFARPVDVGGEDELFIAFGWRRANVHEPLGGFELVRKLIVVGVLREDDAEFCIVLVFVEEVEQRIAWSFRREVIGRDDEVADVDHICVNGEYSSSR